MTFYYGLRRESKDVQRRAAEGILRLREALQAEGILRRTVDETLLLGTWNIREFDSGKYGDRCTEYYKSVFRDDEEGSYRGLMGKAKKYNDWRTYQMSDHLVMWVELRIDFAQEYLRLLGTDEPPTPRSRRSRTRST